MQIPIYFTNNNKVNCQQLYYVKVRVRPSLGTVHGRINIVILLGFIKLKEEAVDETF